MSKQQKSKRARKRKKIKDAMEYHAWLNRKNKDFNKKKLSKKYGLKL